MKRDMESHRKGDLTEAIVIAELKKCGIPVSIPFGDNERYDIVVETPSNSFFSFQIKTGRKQNGVIVFGATSLHTNAEGHVRKKYDDDIDFFLVYFEPLHQLYLIGVNEFDSRILLRVDEPDKHDKTINWAKDYEFDERWPPDETPMIAASSRVDPAIRAALDSLESSGARVYHPDEEGANSQFIAEIDRSTYRIHVETGWVVDGRLRFQPTSNQPVDCHLVYCDSLDRLYVISDSEFRKSILPRVDPPERENSRIKYASDFEFEQNWPPRDSDPTDAWEPAVRVPL